MNIAIIGAGKVGGALATKWAQTGHRIFLGIRDISQMKKPELLENPQITAHSIPDAVAQSEVMLLATPAVATVAVAQSLGDTVGKVIIDAMNIVRGNGPEGFSNTADAILAHTQSREVVKCFNTTGFNNMLDPHYQGMAIDAFMCGDSQRAKELTRQLALDAGFAKCYDVGGNNCFQMMEQFALFWINLALFQGQGREIGFKLLTR